MIDWVTVRLPLAHDPIPSGRVMKIQPDGSIEWQVNCWSDFTGSHDASIRVRSYGSEALDISGNLVKFMQGHNVWGTDDLAGIVLGATRRILSLAGMTVRDEYLQCVVQCGDLKRVDVNGAWALGSRADVRSFLRSAESSTYWKHRGKGSLLNDGTLYFRKASRRSMLKMYCKGDEVAAHKLPAALPFRQSILGWVDDKLRIELQVRSMWLKDRGLARVNDWGDNTATEVLQEAIASIIISEETSVPVEVLDTLPPRLRLCYIAWKEGHDLRAQLAPRTFYRYRAMLLEHGIDIAVKQPRDPARDRVQLRRVLEAVPASIPEWAFGTEALWEPPFAGIPKVA